MFFITLSLIFITWEICCAATRLGTSSELSDIFNVTVSDQYQCAWVQLPCVATRGTTLQPEFQRLRTLLGLTLFIKSFCISKFLYLFPAGNTEFCTVVGKVVNVLRGTCHWRKIAKWEFMRDIGTAGYGLDGPGIESRNREDILLSPKRWYILGPTQLPIQWLSGLFRGGKAAVAWI
jgi:hypothetical protein